MNIFEQYGIKEVADCTLYAIALDKNDDEVYIPIMYLDTLKVSTLEQQASSASARGGQGNPHLITWDFDKEITVNLEDALYSPASQSLMWGGKFGIGKQKIYGAWDPYEYEKDKLGREIYLTKEVITKEEYDALDDNNMKANYVAFICPCDDEVKYLTFTPAAGRYKYASKGDPTELSEERDSEGRFKGEIYVAPNISENAGKEIQEKQRTASIYTCDYLMSRPARPEKAELIIDAFGNFEYEALKYVPENINGIDTEYVVAKNIELCNRVHGLKAKDCADAGIEELEYEWLDTDIKMVSLEGDQDIYYGENMGVRYRTPIDQITKNIMVAQKRLYDSSGNEVQSFTNLELTTEKGVHWELDSYDSKIDFYINVKWGLTTPAGTNVIHFTRAKVGTFYIVDTLNYYNNTMTDMIHPLDYGIDDVYYFDRMEKCVAPRTFAINADRNIKMEQFRQLPQYAHAEITVYIDPRTMKPYEANADHYHRRDGNVVEGNLTIIKQDQIYYKWTRRRAPEGMSLGRQITVDAVHFPGTYRLVGETYSRARDDGKDQRYQFEIPLCKLSPNTNLTLEAAGDPTTFTMSLNVLQRDDGVMMKLTQYDVENAMYDGYCSNSHEIVPTEALFIENECEEKEVEVAILESIEILNPTNQVYCVCGDNGGDCGWPYGSGNGYGMAPAYLISVDSDEDYDDLTTKAQSSDPDISKYGLNRSHLVVMAHYSNGKDQILSGEWYDVEITAGDTTTNTTGG